MQISLCAPVDSDAPSPSSPDWSADVDMELEQEQQRETENELHMSVTQQNGIRWKKITQKLNKWHHVTTDCKENVWVN